MTTTIPPQTDLTLQVRGLNVYYGESHILRDVEMTVPKGEMVCLIGRNGMGKTTLLKTVMGLLKPRSGEVLDHKLAAGNIVHRDRRYARVRAGQVNEHHRSSALLQSLECFGFGDQWRDQDTGYALLFEQVKEVAFALLALVRVGH